MICPNIKTQVLKMYKNEFLKLNKLKIGDEINVEFSYHILRSTYKKNKLERFNNKKLSKGILKENADGLFVESIDNFHFYENTSNGLTGRQRREYYKLIRRKAIFKIRCGLTF